MPWNITDIFDVDINIQGNIFGFMIIFLVIVLRLATSSIIAPGPTVNNNLI